MKAVITNIKEEKDEDDDKSYSNTDIKLKVKYSYDVDGNTYIGKDTVYRRVKIGDEETDKGKKSKKK